jgi:hypothetical protein
MATDKLYSMLTFTAIPIGGTLTLPHGIAVGGFGPQVPDVVLPQFDDAFEVTVTDNLNITLKNTGSASGNCLVMCQLIHPVTRSFGLRPDDGTFQQGMVPRPFVLGSPSGSAGPFPVPVAEVVIFARLTGNDVTGDGTIGNPYRTFFRAIQDVPNIILGGVHYVVDPTGIGVETLPRGYQFPVIASPAARFAYVQTPAFPYYFVNNGVTIRAAPQLLTGIPPADAVVSAGDGGVISTDPATSLATLTIAAPRASWAANALRGRHVIRTAVGFQNSTCCIAGSDATHLFLCNTAARFNGGNGALVLAAGEVLQIVEPSVTFQAPAPAVSALPTGAIQCSNVSSINFQGIHFKCSDNPAVVGLYVQNTPNPFFELCVIDGLVSASIAAQIALHSTTIRLRAACTSSSFTAFESVFLNAGLFLDGPIMDLFDCALIGCAPVSNDSFIGNIPSPNFGIQNVSIDTSTGDGIRCVGNAAIFILNVTVTNSVGDGLHVVGNTNNAIVTNLTGTGNGGSGVHIQDGGVVRVTDNATLISGVGGDMIVGTLPARTWADFRGNVPTFNQYDLQTPFVINVASGLTTPGGDDVTGAGTGGCSGSRLFQR